MNCEPKLHRTRSDGSKVYVTTVPKGPTVSTIYEPDGVGTTRDKHWETMIFGGSFDCLIRRCDDQATAFENHRRAVRFITGIRGRVLIELFVAANRVISWTQKERVWW